MEKILIIVCLTFFLFSCKENDKTKVNLENQIKELKNKLDNVYTPGFGEIMGNISSHHVKLWFAGKNKNWKLAEFEIHEIQEGLEEIEKYQSNRKETEMLYMIKPAMDSISKIIKERNIIQFENSYKLLTNTCNSCHLDTKYEFIKIKVPDFQQNINQVFSISKKTKYFSSL